MIKTLQLSPDSSNVAPVPTSVVAYTTDLTTDRMIIGQGFNSITGDQGGMAVSYAGPADLVTASDSEGQSVVFDYRAITSFEELERSLNISVAASFGWGIFSSDLAASFVRSGTFSQHNSFLFLNVEVTNATEVLRRPMLTQAAMSRAKAGQIAFLDFCGDSYVYGRQTGGQLTAVVQFSSTTVENHEEVSAKISGSVAGYGSGSLKIDEALKSLSGISQTTIHLVRRGGLGAVPSINELADAARQFPTQVAKKGGNPATVAMLTRDTVR